jgi:hypothetical protein
LIWSATFGPRIVGAHDRTETGRGADRRKARDAGADHEDFRRRHLARSRDRAREEAAERMRCLDDRAIAADVGHRRQRVELLRAGDPRDAVHREDRRLPPGERLQQIGVLRRPDEAHQRRALTHEPDFLGARRAHLEHDVGHRPELVAVGDDLGAGLAVRLVADLRRFAGAGLHGNPETLLDQLRDHFRYGGDPLFSRKALAWNSDQQRHSFSPCNDSRLSFA